MRKTGFLDLERSINYDAIDEKIMALAEKGIINMYGEIVEGTAAAFFITTSFLQMTRPGQPIWIVMNTPGGSATECFAICDLMRAAIQGGTPINILGVGQVASAGVALMQMGVKRYSFPLTQYLLHQVRGGTPDSDEEVSYGEERIEEYKRKNRVFMRLISERTGMSVEELINLSRKTDYWLDAASAKNLGPNGLIDEIIEDYPFSI